MRLWRLIAIPALTLLPFGVSGLLGIRHVPSALPTCLEAVPAVDFARSPIDGIWLRQVEITNCGGAPVMLDGISIDAAGDDAGFALLGPQPVLVPVDAPLTLTIGFSPERPGRHAGALRIAADGTPPVEVGLLGEGVAPREWLSGPEPETERCKAALPGGFVTRGACGEASDVRLRPARWPAGFTTPQPETPPAI